MSLIMELKMDELLTDVCPSIGEGINKDFTVEGHEVTTHHAPFKRLIRAVGYLRVIGDVGFTNVEIRIPFSILEEFGLKRTEKWSDSE